MAGQPFASSLYINRIKAVTSIGPVFAISVTHIMDWQNMLDDVLCYLVIIPCRTDPCHSSNGTISGLFEYMVECPFASQTNNIETYQQFVLQRYSAVERCAGCGSPERMDDPIYLRW